MKILIVNTLFTPNVVGGAEKSVQLLVESLSEEANKVVVVTGSATGKDELQERGNIRIYYSRQVDIRWLVTDNYPSKLRRVVRHVNDIYNILASQAVGNIIDRERPNIIHCNNLQGFSVAVWREAARRGIPIVHTLRDYYLLCPPSSMFKHGHNCNKQCITCAFFSFPKKMCSSAVGTVIGNSKFILDRHLTFGYFKNATKQQIIYNAAITPCSLNDKLSRDRKLTLKIGYIGRLDRRKGIEVLLNCARKLTENTFDLIVAGKGQEEYLVVLKQNYRDVPVSYQGFVNATTFYDSIDVLVVPSLWHEPLSRTILEAFAHGVPVVGSNRGGTPEIVKDKVTGFIFDPADENSLLNILKLLVENRKTLEKMKPKVLAKSREFEVDRLLKSYVSVYNSTV